MHLKRLQPLALAALVASPLAAVPAAVGCKAFDETLLDDPGPSCELNRPPVRPPEGGAADNGETYFWAIRDIQIDQREGRWREIGYDLDGLCTGLEDPRVECLPPSSSAPLEEDGVGGIDNALGRSFIPAILVAFEGLDEELRAFQTQGVGVTLLQLTDWNGEDDDARVTVALSQSIFGTSADPGDFDEWSITGSQLRIDGEVWPFPAWDGEDLWWARDDNFLGADPTRPRVSDDNAYIKDRTIVMTLPDRFPIIFGGDQRATQFILSDATATIEIAPDNQTIESMTLVGRFSVLDVLATVGSTGICPGTEDYELAERLLELSADIRAMPNSGGDGAVCDALSLGLIYERGIRARFGGVAQGLGIPNQCGSMPDGGMGDGGTDAGPVDGGPRDSGSMDAGVMDSGLADSGAMDTGARDAGLLDSTRPDSGVVDSGGPAVDSGVRDGSITDSGVPDSALADSGT